MAFHDQTTTEVAEQGNTRLKCSISAAEEFVRPIIPDHHIEIAMVPLGGAISCPPKTGRTVGISPKEVPFASQDHKTDLRMPESVPATARALRQNGQTFTTHFYL